MDNLLFIVYTSCQDSYHLLTPQNLIAPTAPSIDATVITVSTALWKLCLSRLEGDLSAQQFNTWIRPLHAVEHATGLTLLAPNRFVRDFVREEYLGMISSLAKSFSPEPAAVSLDIGSDQAGNRALVATDQPPANLKRC